MPVRTDIVVIVQARVSSRRLPGKVLMPFGDTALLTRIIRRLRPTGLPVWVATSSSTFDDPVAAIAQAEDAGVYRGALDDVLGRFVGCLDAIGDPQPDAVVRICADRPFVSPQLISELVEGYEALGRPDYIANNAPKSYPDGLDLELVRANALREADAETTDPHDREHVTPFVYRHPTRYRLANLPCAYGNFADIRAVIDTQADYDALVAVSARLETGEFLELLNLATLEPRLFP
jgi:spore coat polysaccharide biosynthesis protein SpsF